MNNNNKSNQFQLHHYGTSTSISPNTSTNTGATGIQMMMMTDGNSNIRATTTPNVLCHKQITTKHSRKCTTSTAQELERMDDHQSCCQRNPTQSTSTQSQCHPIQQQQQLQFEPIEPIVVDHHLDTTNIAHTHTHTQTHTHSTRTTPSLTSTSTSTITRTDQSSILISKMAERNSNNLRTYTATSTKLPASLGSPATATTSTVYGGYEYEYEHEHEYENSCAGTSTGTGRKDADFDSITDAPLNITLVSAENPPVHNHQYQNQNLNLNQNQNLNHPQPQQPPLQQQHQQLGSVGGVAHFDAGTSFNTQPAILQVVTPSTPPTGMLYDGSPPQNTTPTPRSPQKINQSTNHQTLSNVNQSANMMPQLRTSINPLMTTTATTATATTTTTTTTPEPSSPTNPIPTMTQTQTIPESKIKKTSTTEGIIHTTSHTKINPMIIEARSKMNTLLQQQREVENDVQEAKMNLIHAQNHLLSCEKNQEAMEHLVYTTAEELTDSLLQLKTTWNMMYEKLVQYKDKYGNCDVKRTLLPHEKVANPDLISLGAWVGRIRSEARKPKRGHNNSERMMEPYKIIALKRQGFDFEPRENYWLENYNKLKEYMAEHGNGKMPSRRKSALGTWCDGQIIAYNKFMNGNLSYITQKKIDLLNDIGFVWDRTSNNWMQKYQRLAEFHFTYGHCNVPKSHLDQVLYRWVGKERTKYRNYLQGTKPSQTCEQFSLLEDINFMEGKNIKTNTVQKKNKNKKKKKESRPENNNEIISQTNGG
jgi:hypothetical protein